MAKSLMAVRSMITNGSLINTGIRTVAKYSTNPPDKQKINVNELPQFPNFGVNPPPNEHLRFRPALMDDLPVPQGDFYEDYRKRNIKYWRHFIQGTLFLAGTIYYLACVQEFIIFEASPPPMPPKEERIKTFWVEPVDDDEDDEDDD